MEFKAKVGKPYSHLAKVYSGGSKRARGTHTPNSKFFQFHAVFGEIWQIRMLASPLGSWRPLLGEILALPLVYVLHILWESSLVQHLLRFFGQHSSQANLFHVLVTRHLWSSKLINIIKKSNWNHFVRGEGRRGKGAWQLRAQVLRIAANGVPPMVLWLRSTLFSGGVGNQYYTRIYRTVLTVWDQQTQYASISIKNFWGNWLFWWMMNRKLP